MYIQLNLIKNFGYCYCVNEKKRVTLPSKNKVTTLGDLV